MGGAEMTREEREARLAEIYDCLGENDKPELAFFLEKEIDRVRDEARREALEEAAKVAEQQCLLDGDAYKWGASTAASAIRVLASRKGGKGK
jgi:hypothetical protein